MPTSEPQTRGTTTSATSTDEPGRPDAPAWPTRDLERRAAATESTPTPTTAAAPTTATAPTTTPTTDRPNGPAPTAATAAAAPTSTTTEGAMAPTGTSPATQTPGALARKAFLADLTRAMRIAAEEQRGSVLASLRAEAEARVATMQGETSEAADAARTGCDAQVAALEEWSAEELRRIRRETEQNIVERRAQLEAELGSQTERFASGVARVEQTIAQFEQQMTAFYKRLLAEEDPTKFAGLAERMPEPAPFGAWSPTGPVEGEASPPDAIAAGTTPTPAESTPAALDMDALEADALAAAEAEALEEDATDAVPTVGKATASVSDGSATTRAVVNALGLVSVASVAAFKRMLGRADGVHSVQVTSGPQGEFVFTITCDPEMDLGAVVAGLPGFQIDLRSVAQGRVDITARELDQTS